MRFHSVMQCEIYTKMLNPEDLLPESVFLGHCLKTKNAATLVKWERIMKIQLRINSLNCGMTTVVF